MAGAPDSPGLRARRAITRERTLSGDAPAESATAHSSASIPGTLADGRADRASPPRPHVRPGDQGDPADQAPAPEWIAEEHAEGIGAEKRPEGHTPPREANRAGAPSRAARPARCAPRRPLRPRRAERPPRNGASRPRSPRLDGDAVDGRDVDPGPARRGQHGADVVTPVSGPGRGCRGGVSSLGQVPPRESGRSSAPEQDGKTHTVA